MKNVVPINGNLGGCRADGHQIASYAIGHVSEQGIQYATTTAADEIIGYFKECDRTEQRSFLIGFIGLLLDVMGTVSVETEVHQ